MTESKHQESDRLTPVSANDETRARPEVIVEFLFDRGRLSLAVRNIGQRPAIGVSVKFDKKIMGLGGSKDISAMALFRNLEFLGPGREIVTFLDSSGSYFAHDQPVKVTAQIVYRDPEGRSFESKFNHDLEIYRELTYLE
ncbi:MAG TPA: hypothetical protein VGW36_01285 [Pyrinomonadaceae bacterium]|nr:hypothetical protein [Pyrinomonadaceae bacterium]